jgi:hypothetical protein
VRLVHDRLVCSRGNSQQGTPLTSEGLISRRELLVPAVLLLLGGIISSCGREDPPIDALPSAGIVVSPLRAPDPIPSELQDRVKAALPTGTQLLGQIAYREVPRETAALVAVWADAEGRHASAVLLDRHDGSDLTRQILVTDEPNVGRGFQSLTILGALPSTLAGVVDPSAAQVQAISDDGRILDTYSVQQGGVILVADEAIAQTRLLDEHGSIVGAASVVIDELPLPIVSADRNWVDTLVATLNEGRETADLEVPNQPAHLQLLSNIIQRTPTVQSIELGSIVHLTGDADQIGLLILTVVEYEGTRRVIAYTYRRLD